MNTIYHALYYSTKVSPSPAKGGRKLIVMSGGRPLIILDMSGTLIQRLSFEDEFDELQRRSLDIEADTTIGRRPYVIRPGAREFLADLLDIADVAVWASAWRKNTIAMAMCLFGGLLSKEF